MLASAASAEDCGGGLFGLEGGFFTVTSLIFQIVDLTGFTNLGISVDWALPNAFNVPGASLVLTMEVFDPAAETSETFTIFTLPDGTPPMSFNDVVVNISSVAGAPQQFMFRWTQTAPGGASIPTFYLDDIRIVAMVANGDACANDSQCSSGDCGAELTCVVGP
ncbi:MAG: hypothetical protein ABW217_09535 [Polyangiaceae bacterium]